jgi:hypothetical protein
MTAKKKLVFILSSNYSGSHFCSLLLGSHSKAEHLGELKNLYKTSGGRPCFACGNDAECDLYKEINSIQRENIYEELFARLGGRSPILIDTSKKPKWFKHFVNDERYDIKLLHLIRDPRALARRWLMRFKELNRGPRERIKQCRKDPLRAPLFLFGDLLSVCIYKWCTQNKEIAEFVSQSGRPSKLITYRNLAFDQDSTLAEVCQWMGVEYELGQKEYWNFVHHGTQKHEYEWVKRQGGAQFFDLRWKDFLTPKQQEKIIGNKSVNRLLDDLGLEFSDDGLVKKL